MANRKKPENLSHSFSSSASPLKSSNRCPSSWQTVKRKRSTVVFSGRTSTRIRGYVLFAHVLRPRMPSGNSIALTLSPFRSSSLKMQGNGPSPQFHCSRKRSAALATSSALVILSSESGFEKRTALFFFGEVLLRPER